jgi:hypothetical protein
MALDKFKGTFPYASELFGIYQPLLGWRSKLITRRFEGARFKVYRSLADRLMSIQPEVSVRTGPERGELRAMIPHVASVTRLRPLRFPQEIERYVAPQIDTAVARLVSQKLEREPPTDWRALVGYDEMTQTLRDVQQIVTSPDLLEKNTEVADYVNSFLAQSGSVENEAQITIQALFEREASIAGYLSFLSTHSPSRLTVLFYRHFPAVSKWSDFDDCHNRAFASSAKQD